MTEQDAAVLRSVWRREGATKCEHLVMVRLRKLAELDTAFACARCGGIVRIPGLPPGGEITI